MHYLFFSLFLCLSSNVVADLWSGSDYAQNSSVQLSHAERLLHSITLRGDEILLDVGCGNGAITAKLAERVPLGKVIGIDPSDSMLAQAEATLHKSGLSNLTFYPANAEHFSFNERFDHILAIHVMHWVKDQEIALKNIHTHLKNDGHVHLILAPSKEGLPFHRALQRTMQAWKEDFVEFVNPQQAFDMEIYRQLLVNAGFQIDAIHYLYHESTFENKEKLQAWVKQWLPHAKHLPSSKQAAFLDELIDAYARQIPLLEHSGKIPWGEYVLIIHAKSGPKNESIGQRQSYS